MAELGTVLGQQLAPGDAVCLVGPLGAGKTTFTRGLARGLEIRGEVTSPTFVIARRHRGLRVDLLHCDAYRISSPDEFADLDLDTDEAVTVVEWGQSVMAEISDSWLEVAIDRSSSHDEGTRQVTVCGRGDRWTATQLDLLIAAFRRVIS
ncbi:MAG: tRNA (adenosine(37)-N6)-threonylcarbamoyltransferase complex ATPase subunit type 1 TsaE [Micrococcales bacterium]|nr:tRNA (adenosine(37)-N6)-threonylcarbamoyltransferase complex ATPase subunit type 1 TsaE [Micrococcales bacterium]